MARPKKVKEETATAEDLKIQEPVESVTVDAALIRSTYTYPVPETREDYLALHQCLKDTGVNGIGDLEVKASKL